MPGGSEAILPAYSLSHITLFSGNLYFVDRLRWREDVVDLPALCLLHLVLCCCLDVSYAAEMGLELESRLVKTSCRSFVINCGVGLFLDVDVGYLAIDKFVPVFCLVVTTLEEFLAFLSVEFVF